MSTDPQIYFNKAYATTARLLSLLDRNAASATYGCFDRNFWHFRTADFPNAAKQQGLKVLAQLWSLSYPGNAYFQSPEILSLLQASLLYTTRIQNRDGSFDEWYVNERGWAGPTGYVLHAICFAFAKCKATMNTADQQRILDGINKAAEFLCMGWERDVLANHIAIAALALHDAYTITQNTRYQEACKQLIGKIDERHNFQEGWSMEYDGPDVGYQSATLSFLCRILPADFDDRIVKICESSFAFLSRFILPNGDFIHNIGSRQSANLFQFGIESMANRKSDWSAANSCRLGILQELATSPADHDDCYFLYRLPEFYDALQVAQTGQSSIPLPANSWNGTEFLSHAGIAIRSWQHFYVVFSTSRGGAIAIWNRQTQAIQLTNNGLVLRQADGSLLTNLWMDADALYCQTDQAWELRVPLKKIKMPTFTPVRFIGFRLFMLVFGFHHRSAYLLKSWIRRALMLGKRNSQIRFFRSVSFTAQNIRITDTLEDSKGILNSAMPLYWGGTFHSRYIPQTKYFTKAQSICEFKKVLTVADLRQNPALLSEEILCAE